MSEGTLEQGDGSENLDAIWAGDLFDRKSEAQQIIAYLESVVAAPFDREDKKAFTLAIDAGYGEGKTFFLGRLAKTLALNHPVAMVDAWADDLADDPLTALAATLKKALAPVVAQDSKSAKRLGAFMQKSGKVARIVSLGLLRRGLGLLITAQAVDAAGEVLDGVGDDVREAVEDGLAEAGKGIVDDATSASRTQSLMESRIAEFEAGRAAVEDMKQSLRSIVEALSEDGQMRPPIFIIIDELDRCRPTYAIRVLEEIKHLFDVPGLVFILAMHSEQLGYSVRGAYGADFNGHAYLRRFIDRQYQLAVPEMHAFVSVLYETAGLSDRRMEYFPLGLAGQPTRDLALPKVIAIYMREFEVAARDAYEIIDTLRTCQALAADSPLLLPYLLPLIIGKIKGLPEGFVPEKCLGEWTCRPLPMFNSAKELLLSSCAEKFRTKATLGGAELRQRMGSGEGDPFAAAIYHVTSWSSSPPPIWSPARYNDLLKSVSRFRKPRLGS